MIIRFRSKDGMQRIECKEDSVFGDVLNQLIPKLSKNVDLSTITVGEKQDNTKLATEVASSTLKELGLKHGDLIFINYKEHAVGADKSRDERHASSSVTISPVSVAGPLKVQELKIDEELEKEDGLIPRPRSNLCRHGDKGMCEYCSPLPPWDKGYQEEHSIKHISFHAYLKEINDHTNKKSSGSSYISPLSQPDFRINKKCPAGHEPWPRGICSKCQPSAITLQQQAFRMVDHVEFQKSDLVNEFIDSWRTTGTQRFGYLYGHYDRYKNTPLGIMAVVEAIYEPPQHDEQDGLTMDINQVKEELLHVDKIANEMGLLRLGLIFTDLTDTGKGDGSVFCKRHKDSFFLSSLEVIMAAKQQLEHPNVCKFSEQGVFSSKFVTCVVSGNTEEEIDISSYQVSTDAEALVQADMISGSTHPSMAYINETTVDRYVPEIFYMKKNEYGLTVKENAKPAFPVDYLIVSLTHGFPKADAPSEPKFQSCTDFPWCNRQAMGYSQDYHQLKKYLIGAATGGDFGLLQQKLSNFHLLLYIHSLQILSSNEWQLLLKAATAHDQEALFALVSSPGWQTLVMILQESS
ncbi:LAFE_0G15214g1_1 [Lachancea fermentati]|uniref:Nuclear protein localization protein 4 n=1 Tax=Lachancea fermentati TaxID=4955 RepID=A0A1G4MIJ6_LACFM|nr:LAFE_0G15214g1_1 [Lachancea fermentati]